MAKSLRVEADPLRNSLDELASRLVKKTIEDKEASTRTLAEALKAASSWWGMSRGKQAPEGKDPPGSAWAKYSDTFTGAADGKAH